MQNLMLSFGSDSATLSAVTDDLIIKIAEGNKEAFHQLYQQVSKNIYGFALSITKNTHDAEDVLQDTFLTVYRRAHTYKAQGKPIAWLLTIARNLSLMKLRDAAKSAEADDYQIEEALASGNTALSDVENLELNLLLGAALRILSDEERQILMLHAVSGLKNREIAKILELPIGTVLSKYHRATKKLKEYMQKGGYDYGG